MGLIISFVTYGEGASHGVLTPVECQNCVPRGCSCNEELNEGIALDSKEAEDPQNYHQKLDERGRKYPCVEYWFVDNEFEKEQRVPIECLRGDRGD
jgi:hypothetical protein